MGNAEDFLVALALALLLGVSIVAILEIIDELLKAKQPVDQETIRRRLREEGYDI